MMPRPVPGRKVPRDPVEDPEIARHSDAMRARIERYDAFERFQLDAPSRLPRLYAQLGAGRFYRDYYSLCVCPGGAMGGQDRRTLQVFFGHRPFDFTLLPPTGGHAPVPFTPGAGKRTLSERGAELQYSRTDRGEVICILRPAQTEFTTPLESEILLDEVDPVDLESPAVLERHLRWLLAYMAGTSLDGVRFPGQRWRFWVLRNLRLWRDKTSGHWRPTRAFEAAYWMAKWVFTVSLSGSLLYVIQRAWPLPDAVTPAVTRAAATAHQDQQALLDALKRAGVTVPQSGHADVGVPPARSTSAPPSRATDISRHGR